MVVRVDHGRLAPGGAGPSFFSPSERAASHTQAGSKADAAPRIPCPCEDRHHRDNSGETASPDIPGAGGGRPAVRTIAPSAT